MVKIRKIPCPGALFLNEYRKDAEEITYKNVLALQSWVHRQNQYGLGSFLPSVLGCLTASPSEFSLSSFLITHIPVQSRAEQSCSAQIGQVPMCALADKLIWGRASQSLPSVSKPKQWLFLPLSSKFNPDIIIRAVYLTFLLSRKQINSSKLERWNWYVCHMISCSEPK